MLPQVKGLVTLASVYDPGWRNFSVEKYFLAGHIKGHPAPAPTTSVLRALAEIPAANCPNIHAVADSFAHHFGSVIEENIPPALIHIGQVAEDVEVRELNELFTTFPMRFAYLFNLMRPRREYGLGSVLGEHAVEHHFLYPDKEKILRSVRAYFIGSSERTERGWCIDAHAPTNLGHGALCTETVIWATPA